MFLERLKLTNFQCFGPESTTIRFDQQLTALLGANATGKTAACQALLRLFSVMPEQRQVRVEDFHVPNDDEAASDHRELTIEAVFAFPELAEAPAVTNGGDGAAGGDTDANNGDNGSNTVRAANAVDADADPGATTGAPDPAATVPEFFTQMTAEDNGELKLRIVLQASWSPEGLVTGTIDESRRIVHTFAEDYGTEWIDLRPSDRNRIQMVYVPATRDGARQVTAFLRGRLWRASQWSSPFRDHVGVAADELTSKFRDEPVVATVTEAISTRWQELHHLALEQRPFFEPINRDVSVLVTNAEMLFEPSPAGRTRSARELSDGQQSLLHIALTAATLDLEAAVSAGDHDDKFDITATALPTLTLLALEEPENNLAPFFLSRVIQQLLGVTSTGRAQALISSHSAGVMSRIEPEQVRHFRLDVTSREARVREILLPDNATDEGKYIREAVRAHPELYFARFVVLGEGDSEALVLPKLAAASGLHIDQSFVAIVSLGGRHTNHFWRLLNQLEIPHATLLDLDWGRAGGGEGRIRDACTRLLAIGIDPFDGSNDIASFTCTDDIESLDQTQLVAWIKHLEKWDIYFSAPLDLDMVLLTRFKSAYTDHLEPGKTGPSRDGDPRNAVLGDPGVRPAVEYWDDKVAELRWYRYLFVSNSKPSTHLHALSHVDPTELAAVGGALSRLVDRIGEAVTPS